MVLRIAGYGYQKGFGGHFHNDNAIAALRDIPGIIIASPARPDDAMMHTCAAAARTAGALCVYLEPIALYHTRDLHDDGDEQWPSPYPDPTNWSEHHVPIGRARTYGEGTDLTIVTYGNGLHMSLRVARRLDRAQISSRVVDMRWLAPLPIQDIVREANATGPCPRRRRNPQLRRRRRGRRHRTGRRRIHRPACPRRQRGQLHPLGDAALEVLLSEDTIEAAAIKLTQVSR